jgi:hypothetical protein
LDGSGSSLERFVDAYILHVNIYCEMRNTRKVRLAIVEGLERSY